MSKRRLKDLLLQQDNRICADCNAPDPKWASANIGVFICLKCCGVHRSLGAEVSKVLSVTLDEWSDEDVDALIEVGGNASANSIYEAYIPEGITKPGPDAGHDARSKFIRSKYELQEFVKPSLRIVSQPDTTSSQANLRSSGKKSVNEVPDEIVAESIGVIKIRVIKGTNLVVRDVKTSDPYVVLSIGKQTVKTSVMKRELNPVWNEELKLYVSEPHGKLKLQVFDHDTLSADDTMGEANIDLQPMITSASSYGDAGDYGDMQIGKWLKSDDNALIEDSPVKIFGGKFKQEMSLKLKNVETGEVYIEFEWSPVLA